jgi:hypothetical protein
MNNHRRFKAAGLHLLVCAGVATLVVAGVNGVWFPPPHAKLSGGWGLLTLMLSVDIVLGPLLTLVVAGSDKPLPELRRDIAVIAALQIAALVYGISVLAAARPIFEVFEVDRFRVVSMADIDPTDLSKAPSAYRQPSWTGPVRIGARPAESSEEMLQSLDLSLRGQDLAFRPGRWAPYVDFHDAVLKSAKPVDRLRDKYPEAAGELEALARKAQMPVGSLRYLPIQARMGVATAVLGGAEGVDVIGYLDVDPFF